MTKPAETQQGGRMPRLVEQRSPWDTMRPYQAPTLVKGARLADLTSEDGKASVP